MPNFESIMKWYNQSQIEYITPFLKLWFAFEGYLKQIFPDKNNQRDLIEKIKTESHLYVWFEKYLDERSEKGEIFRNTIERLTKLTDIEPLLNNRGDRVSFLSLIDKNEKVDESDVYKLHGVNLIRDSRAIYNQLIEVIYQIRCSLMHGNFSLDNPVHQELLEKAYISLNMMFSNIINGR